MIFSLLKKEPHFIRSNKSNSLFEFEDDQGLYAIRIRRKFDISKNDNVTLEFPKHDLLQCPMWYRRLVRQVEDYYYEKYKSEYEKKKQKLPLNYVLFLFEMVSETGDVNYIIHEVQEGFKTIVKSVDFEIWDSEWENTFANLQRHLHKYGYCGNIIEEYAGSTLYQVSIEFK